MNVGNRSRRMSVPQQYFVPSSDVVTSIVLPTIIFCIAMVVAMLIGINKCKQWELDKVIEMRRTRLVVQRITARLREKNFRTIQKARSMRQRKRNLLESVTTSSCFRPTSERCAPPSYSLNFHPNCGTSPPPSYEDALLDEYYNECFPGR